MQEAIALHIPKNKEISKARKQLNQNKITNEELKVLVSERNNVATEYRFTLKCIKNGKP